MRFECWIIEATDTCLEYVTLLENQSYRQKIFNIFNVIYIYIYIYIYVCNLMPNKSTLLTVASKLVSSAQGQVVPK